MLSYVGLIDLSWW